MQNKAILEVKSLKKYFPVKGGFFHRTKDYLKAVNDVSFTVNEGEVFGLVGESGCGKTTTGKCIMMAIEPTEGQVIFHKNKEESVDLTTLNFGELRILRRDMQMIFQDPYSSLNPRMTVKEIIGEPLKLHRIVKNEGDLIERVEELLAQVELRREYMDRYPHSFSGGQRQRIGIARALSLNPRFLVCDEPISALDVSVQAQILNLLRHLQRDFNLSYLFIAHDLSAVKHISDRVAVMYMGRIVEVAASEMLFSEPKHPYTEALMASVPIANPRLRSRERSLLKGEVYDLLEAPDGCPFHPRCKYLEEICKSQVPKLQDVSGHKVACHFAGELELTGIQKFDLSPAITNQ